MILGQSRTPFQRPAAANPAFAPKMPNVGFYTAIHPFAMVTERMAAASMYRAPLPPTMGPTTLPDVPAAAPAPAPVGPVVPKPGGTAGFGGSGFGSTGGVQSHFHVDPYTVMRQGMIPGVSPSGGNIRAGIQNAGSRVQRSLPFQTAPLAPEAAPAPVVAPAMAPPAPTMKGVLGAIADHLGFNPGAHHYRLPRRHRRMFGF